MLNPAVNLELRGIYWNGLELFGTTWTAFLIPFLIPAVEFLIPLFLYLLPNIGSKIIAERDAENARSAVLVQ